MNKLPIMQIDAFTTRRFCGNPCAVVLEAEGLSETAMQDIAREMNLSETAFVMSSEEADFRARYFTPSEEIPLAGHPTIATIHALIVNGIITLKDHITVQLELQAGVVSIEVSRTEAGLSLITMFQLRPQFLRSYEPANVLPAFGLAEEDALSGAPIMTVSTGTPQLMVPLASLDVLKRARLSIDLYTELHSSGDFFSPHLFVLEGVSEQGSTFARHFGLPPDTLEDPFTGSATGGMAAYLWHHGLIEEPKFIAEQGYFMGRPGEAYVEVVGPPDEIKTVKVGGFAVEVMRGELETPDESSTRPRR